MSYPKLILITPEHVNSCFEIFFIIFFNPGIRSNMGAVLRILDDRSKYHQLDQQVDL